MLKLDFERAFNKVAETLQRVHQTQKVGFFLINIRDWKRISKGIEVYITF